MKPHTDWWQALRNAALAAAALLASALFAANLGGHLVARSLCCADDAFIAVAAKNLATGHGYASSYNPAPDGSTAPRRFDPFITTGPGLVAPAAAAIRVFGNRYWVPGAVVVALELLLLALLFRELAVATRDPCRWAPAIVVGIVALNLLSIGYYEQWYALLGEIPALLLLCLGVVLAFGAGERRYGVAAGGLLFGLAYQVKTIAALAVPVALVAIALHAARGVPASPGSAGRSAGARLRRGLRAVAVAAACFCVPTLIFEAFKLADLGGDGYLEAKAAAARFMETSRESGVRALLEAHPVEHVHATAARNWPNLSAYFGSGWTAAAFLTALALGLGARDRWRGADSAIPLVLTAMAAAYFAWWLLLSAGGKIRYLLVGLGLWCFAVVFDLFPGRWSPRKAALAVAFAAAVLPRVENVAWIAPPRPLFQPSPGTAAMLEARQFLEEHRQGSVIVADWWATGVDMEYLLAGSGNLVHHHALGRLDAPRVLLFENAKWIDWAPGTRDAWQDLLARHGATLAFERGPYRIYAAEPAPHSTK